MTIVIAGLDRTEVLAALCVQAYLSHWRPMFQKADLSKDISTIDDAKEIIRLYGFFHIEYSLGIDLGGIYFSSSEYDARFGFANNAIEPLKNKTTDFENCGGCLQKKSCIPPID